MNGTGAEWAHALAVGALLFGIVGTLLEAPWITIAAFVMLFAALGAIVTDTTSPDNVLAVSGFVVGIVGGGATIAGYAIGSDLLAFGGLVVVVLATVVTVAEMWGAT